MKIALDFDDVIADTMSAVVTILNEDNGTEWTLDHVEEWNFGPAFGLTQRRAQAMFDTLDYSRVEPILGSIGGIRSLISMGHSVEIVTSNPREEVVREWLDRHGVPVNAKVQSLPDKVPYLQNRFDLVFDDNLATIESHNERSRLGKGFLFARPWNIWNRKPGTPIVSGWWGLLQEVTKPNAPTVEEFNNKLKQVKERFDAMLGYKFDHNHGDEIVVNWNGAKQTKIDGRFDLLPPVAVAEVAKVLMQGADKYGVDNWRGLSIDEITNHTLAHLFHYYETRDIEDLSHAACRALMALELALLEE